MWGGWLSLCGAPPRGLKNMENQSTPVLIIFSSSSLRGSKRKCTKRRATIRYGVEPGGRLVSLWWKLFMKCCCCGTGFRACPRRPRHRRGRGAARLRRRVARRSAACPPATPGNLPFLRTTSFYSKGTLKLISSLPPSFSAPPGLWQSTKGTFSGFALYQVPCSIGHLSSLCSY